MAYSTVIPAVPGYYVYRLWAGGTCLYVGRIGDNGPRPPHVRIGKHRYYKAWWPEVNRIDIATLPDHRAIVAEEAAQIALQRPRHNVRRGNCGHDLSLPGAVTRVGACRECNVRYQREYRAKCQEPSR